MLAIVSSLSFAPGCTLVIGDEPAHKEDAAMDGRVLDEDDAATGLEEAGVMDASTPADGGALDDARGTLGSDAATLDAATEAGADAAREDAGPSDSGVPDTGPPLDCDGGGTLYYPDGDNDGYGRSAELVKRCTKPTDGVWATRGGDCKDNDLSVHPQQTAFFGEPYMGGDGKPSFDYDCSGAEEGETSETLTGSCGLLELLACMGRGYVATQRSGANVNPFCGSTTRGYCMSAGILGCTTAEAPNQPAYRCK